MRISKFTAEQYVKVYQMSKAMKPSHEIAMAAGVKETQIYSMFHSVKIQLTKSSFHKGVSQEMIEAVHILKSNASTVTEQPPLPVEEEEPKAEDLFEKLNALYEQSKQVNIEIIESEVKKRVSETQTENEKFKEKILEMEQEKIAYTDKMLSLEEENRVMKIIVDQAKKSNLANSLRNRLSW